MKVVIKPAIFIKFAVEHTVQYICKSFIYQNNNIHNICNYEFIKLSWNQDLLIFISIFYLSAIACNSYIE